MEVLSKMDNNAMLTAMVASHEQYLGELLGRYIEAQAKLRIAAQQIKEFEEAKVLFEKQQEQVKEAHASLKSVTSNKDAFEQQNTNLLETVNLVKGQIADLKTALQLEKETRLRWEDRYKATLKKRGRPKKED
jgi:chromosome segregation ATPase